MGHWIERIVEPNRLLLAWQAADLTAARFRWAVGEIERRGAGHSFRYLADGPEFAMLNDGRSYQDLLAAGYVGYPAFKRRAEPFDQAVMSAFRRRLPSRERSDYADYLEHFRLTPGTATSDFALLGLTGATLPSDGFSIVDPFDNPHPGRDLFMEVAGYRHYAYEARLQSGEAVTFALEPLNPHDPNAVIMRVDDRAIGYVNRLRTGAFQAWVAEGRLRGVVERLNGRPDHPRAFVFVQVDPEAARVAA